MAVHPYRLRSPHDASAASTPAPDARAAPTRGARGAGAAAKRAVSHLATAALLLLTLVAGYVAALRQAPETPRGPGWTPAMVRALGAAPGDIDDEVLAEATFGLDQLPAGDKEALFYRLTIPPGATLTALAGPSCICAGWPVSGGVGAEVVQSGVYSVRLAAPMQVQRRGAAGAAAIPAHTDITLGPGDAAIYSDYTADATITVVGDAPVQLVGMAIVGNETSGELAPKLPDGVRGEEFSRSVPSDWEKVAGGPVGVSLRLVTLPAGTRIGPYEPIGLEAMRVERGQITRHYFEPGAADPTGPPMNWVEGRVAPLLGIRPGMRYDMTSSGDEPTELLVLIIEPVGVTARTLSP